MPQNRWQNSVDALVAIRLTMAIATTYWMVTTRQESYERPSHLRQRKQRSPSILFILHFQRPYSYAKSSEHFGPTSGAWVTFRLGSENTWLSSCPLFHCRAGDATAMKPSMSLDPGTTGRTRSLAGWAGQEAYWKKNLCSLKPLRFGN